MGKGQKDKRGPKLITFDLSIGGSIYSSLPSPRLASLSICLHYLFIVMFVFIVYSKINEASSKQNTLHQPGNCPERSQCKNAWRMAVEIAEGADKAGVSGECTDVQVTPYMHLIFFFQFDKVYVKEYQQSTAF